MMMGGKRLSLSSLGAWFCIFLLAVRVEQSFQLQDGILNRKFLGVSHSSSSNSNYAVQLQIQDKHVILDNGLVQITFTKPGGVVSVIKYNGIENLLDGHEKKDRRGYWDLEWSRIGQRGRYDHAVGTEFKVIKESPEQVELSFTVRWNPSNGNSFALNIDKRFIMMRGSSGFYAYGIYERLPGWPAFDLGNSRLAFKLNTAKFHYMAISDDRQRIMPTPQDRSSGQRLNYPEAVLLTNPSNPDLKGEVDDKYQYSCENKDNRVHGWISNTNQSVGFWMITPSDEFRTGGPLKQDLTSHVGPTTLAVFSSSHYAGWDAVDLRFVNGEPWKKVYGPVFIYLNSVSNNQNAHKTLWNDAKDQMRTEVQSWPYSFPVSDDYPSSNQRGTVSGRLLVQDNQEFTFANAAYVGLAPPGQAGSWQTQGKGYQFWVKTNKEGYFTISNVREGDYNLNAWVPGFIGDFKRDGDITITAGCDINLGDLVFRPPRNGPTLWEIGIPDRSAKEFYIPDPNPRYINKLFVSQTSNSEPSSSSNKFRQYGLWERYTELYPYQDLIYRIGVSDYRNDWFFAHVTRNAGNSFQPSTWQVAFPLANVNYLGTYTLRLAFASATNADLHVRVNNPQADGRRFKVGLTGRDNAIARHGIHGLYWLFHFEIPGYLLVRGTNTLYITQSRCTSPFTGIMYDYLRLEGPSGYHFKKSG
ncbi:hypothetical protein GIB67_036988 [Kingdonia uniflora]|uniref:rhamnogalacturonan endolyase n=1 Tax=Kingdonia uniflora TaxID=39325 RepID=A0A7J7L2H5_9MAGN|nr:hypothetical protein GIB67_036988 [Kingdonia uniflora]